MNRYLIWILVGSMLMGLLGISSMSLAEEGKWAKKADMPTPRSGLSTCVVNGKIYAIGGGEIPSIVEEYDPVTDIWTKKASVPTARSAFSASAVNGKIYAIGGMVKGETVSTVEEYDPVTDKWTKKANMPTPRAWLSTSAVNGKIYAMGGERVAGGFGLVVPTVEEYDPVTNKWTKKADMPPPRSGLSASMVNGKIYTIGGSAKFVTVNEYNPSTDKWTNKADIPTRRGYLSTSVVNGKIYVVGGWDGMDKFFSTVEEYDPSTDTWTKKASMPTARAWLSASVANGKIYAIGGSNGRMVLATVEEYDTGFRDLAVKAKGKLATLWGKIKSRY